MEKEKSKKLLSRPPVVVVLGHVDHGKSSLLEAIKDFKIISKESGGITQHIGAYEIEEKGKNITFIDTPGHEAFSAMRARGVDIADIAILVVAGDEAVMPQTKEAVAHIKKAGIPMIIAINKIDKPTANPEKIKRELATQDVLVESMAGKIPCVEVSAKTKKGIPELLEMILLIAEMENLTGDISKQGKGVVIESYLDHQRGPVATVILQEGIVREGDFIGTNSVIGRVKSLENFQGDAMEKALPAMPAIIVGFESVPGVGEEVIVFKNIDEAQKEIKEKRKVFFQPVEAGQDKKVLNLILKVDVFGSLEAIEQVLRILPQTKVAINVLKADAGDIGEADVKLAMSAKAAIIGFRVKISPTAQKMIEREKITIIVFDIIYELSQAIRHLLEKKVSPDIVKVNLGSVKILAVFKTEKNRQVIGGKVVSGRVKKGDLVDVCRDKEKIGSGKIVQLQKNKKETDEVLKGAECGMLFEGNIAIEEGCFLEAYVEDRRKGVL